ncbi:MAG: diacylglycerol kinase family protein [Flavobacteriales bacterium]
MKKFYASIGYAIKGVIFHLKYGANFKIQLFFACTALILCFSLHVALWEWVVVFVLIGSVLALESFNSALEILCNYITTEKHDQIKHVKDLCASGVLIVAFCSIIIGSIIFIPKIITLIN